MVYGPNSTPHSVLKVATRVLAESGDASSNSPNPKPEVSSQTAQHGLIKEYTLSYMGIPNMIEGIFLDYAILGSLGPRMPSLFTVLPASSTRSAERLGSKQSVFGPEAVASGLGLDFVYRFRGVRGLGVWV